MPLGLTLYGWQKNLEKKKEALEEILLESSALPVTLTSELPYTPLCLDCLRTETGYPIKKKKKRK